MRQTLFEHLVAEALDALPEEFRQKLDNVEVLVEDWPDAATLRAARVRSRRELLGFYHGVPQTKRTANYGLVPPDRISIYRWPILLVCRTPEEIRATVQRVVQHEIGHHFGLDDDRLREIGAY